MSTRLKLRPSNVTPPDKFLFVVPEDGQKIESFDREGWFLKIADHYRWNGYHLPEDYKAIAENQLCQRLSGDWCEYETGENYMGGINVRFGLDDMIAGTRVLASFTLGGMKTVEQSVAEERALTCSRCYMNMPIPGCSACFGLLNIIAEVVGNKSTASDASLKQCAICKCSNRAQVFVTGEDLVKGVSPEQREQFSRVEFCWKRKLLEPPITETSSDSLPVEAK